MKATRKEIQFSCFTLIKTLIFSEVDFFTELTAQCIRVTGTILKGRSNERCCI